MPTGDYKCKACGRVFEHDATVLPQALTKTHDDCPSKELKRIWSFSVGRGTSGGTPPR